ncbi:MAG: glycosyltransferase [Chitinophagaceae bacterium]|nr:glycosyltransferase [Chitinophagaceae bacterium]
MKQNFDTLVILSPGFAADEADSTCLPLQQELVLSINRQFPELKIVVLAFQYPFISGTYSWHGNRIIALNGRNRPGLFRLLTWLKAWRALKRLHRKEPMLGILSFWLGECAVVGHYAARSFHLPHFNWILGQDARPHNRWARFLKKHPEELVALSDFVSDEFAANYGVRPAQTITPGINPARYPVKPDQQNIDIIAAGSLIPVKRYELFIEIVAALRNKFPGIRVLLCGEGKARTRLQQLITEAGLQNVITLAGEKSNSEVLASMQRSRVLLHPSAYEGFGVVCLEALYAGAHVVSFCRPQHAWIRHWHYVNDKSAMLKKMEELLSDPNLDHNPVLPYSIDDTAQEMIRLFRS